MLFLKYTMSGFFFRGDGPIKDANHPKKENKKSWFSLYLINSGHTTYITLT
jgi:hypothetical protein